MLDAGLLRHPEENDKTLLHGELFSLRSRRDLEGVQHAGDEAVVPTTQGTP